MQKIFLTDTQCSTETIFHKGSIMKISKFISLNFIDELASKYVVRSFVWALVFLMVTTFVAAAGLNYHFSQYFIGETIVQLLVEIFSASAIVFFAFFIYVYFIGPTPASQALVIRPQDVGTELEKLPLDTRSYMFWGRSGSYFRAVPLQEMDKLAQQIRRSISIKVLLPDPRDNRLTNSYNEILRSLGEEQDGNELLVHVLATCTACAIVSAKNKYLDIEIYLSTFIPGFRLDLSDRGAILTQDDKNKPALLFVYDSGFYDAWQSTMIDECKISTKLNWDEQKFVSLSLEESEFGLDILRSFGVDFEDYGDLRSHVASLVCSRSHRYE